MNNWFVFLKNHSTEFKALINYSKYTEKKKRKIEMLNLDALQLVLKPH